MPVQFHNGVVLFNGSGKVAMHADCCCDGTTPCTFCSSGSAPDILTVRFTGITNQLCSYCTSLNGTDIELTKVGFGTSSCTWSYTGLPSICSPYDGDVDIDATLWLDGSNYKLKIQVTAGATGHLALMTWEKDFGTSKPNCETWSSESIPYDSYGGTPGCKNDSSTCAVSA